MKKIKNFQILKKFGKYFSEQKIYKCEMIKRKILSDDYIQTKFRFVDGKFDLEPCLHVKL